MTTPPPPPADAPRGTTPALPPQVVTAADSAAGMPPVPPPGSAASVPGYELLEELGRGGMGVVYKARQARANRVVALKMILAAGHASKSEVTRFLAEAEAAARLRDPNLVQVYEVGEHDGLPYFSLEYCSGGTLADRLRGGPLPPAEAAALVETLARAIDAAHRGRVVHRDLKPANVLFSEDGQPKVADFGLAKMLDEAGPTASGAVLGTPSYMAPEQAGGEGKRVGPAADVYALGAILYECLTGRPPFQGPTPLDTVRQVVADDPVAPRQLQPKTPRDLETVCLKCLHKDPAKRYASAEALADDLRRFRDGEPVHARPIGLLERSVKWAKRRPAAAAALLLLLAVAAGSAGLAVWLGRVAEKAEKARESADKSYQREQEQRRQAEGLAREIRLNLYAARVNLAQDSWAQGDLARAVELLEGLRPPPGQDNLRGFEWHYLWRLCHSERLGLRGHAGQVRCVAFTPDGRTVATAGEDGSVRLWSAATGEQLRLLRGHKGVVCSLAVSPDGTALATGGRDRVIKLWDLPSGRERATLEGHGEAVIGLAFMPDGRTLVSGSGGMATGTGTPLSRFFARSKVGEVKLWDVPAGRLSRTLHSGPAGVVALALAGDGKTLAASIDLTLRVWDLTKQGQPPATLGRVPAPVLCLAFAPDGRTLAAGDWDSRVTLWDVPGRRARVSWQGHRGPVLAAAFAPDGQALVTGGADQLVKVWDPANQAERFTIRGHTDAVWSVAFPRKGGALATASWDGTVKLWDPARRQEYDTLPVKDAAYSVAFAPDSQVLASGGRVVQLWNARDGRPLRTLPDYRDVDVSVAFSPDGKTLAAAGYSGLVTLWEVGAWRRRADLKGHTAKVWALAFSPDGRTLATGGGRSDHPGEIRLWNVRDGRVKAAWAPESWRVRALAYSPDGKVLAASHHLRKQPGDAVKLLDAETGAVRGTLRGGRSMVDWVAFAPDGRTLATGRSDRAVRLWDADTGELRAVLKGHKDVVFHGAYAPDGKTLATASWDGTVKLWHAATGQELVTLQASEGGVVYSVAFAPDGRTLAAGSLGKVTLWRASDPGGEAR